MQNSFYPKSVLAKQAYVGPEHNSRLEPKEIYEKRIAVRPGLGVREGHHDAELTTSEVGARLTADGRKKLNEKLSILGNGTIRNILVLL
jgi:hypothetical protein